MHSLKPAEGGVSNVSRCEATSSSLGLCLGLGNISAGWGNGSAPVLSGVPRAGS